MLNYIFFLVCAINYVNCAYTYETKWFEVPVDHFSFARNDKFKIKYLANEEHWDRAEGPIFFYTGNEGQIELFAKHTGFMWEIAEEFSAKIVFAEHRYYGQSMPFGNKSLDNDHIGYLTSEQALNDYADLITCLQGDLIKPKYPVIVFGGSYGGMLAAYMRLKYPHLVSGAIAASAPIHMFSNMISCETFNVFATTSYNIAGSVCTENIRRSWPLIRSYTKNQSQAQWLQKNWNLCDAVTSAEDAGTLMDFLQSMYVTIAMVNYPFATDFLVPLPANPVRFVCQYLYEKLDGEALLQGVGKVLKVFTNYDGKTKCVDYKKGDDYGNLDASGWDYQACTEMVMPVCANGKTDMFEPAPWNLTKYSADCFKKYKVYPQESKAVVSYGGMRLQAASNIVFSNGLQDPWAAGGVMGNITDTVIAVMMFDGAHHLDLMPSHPEDPNSVRTTREIHKQNIANWIKEFRHLKRM